MNKILLIISILLAMTVKMCDEAKEEGPTEDEKKIYRSEKIGFITKQLNLTEEEAQKFWPVYNELEEERKELWREKRRYMFDYYDNNENMSEQEHQEALNKYLYFENKECEFKNNQVEKLKEILPPHKIMILFYTETQFKHFILNKLKGRHPRNDGRWGMRERHSGKGRACDSNRTNNQN